MQKVEKTYPSSPALCPDVKDNKDGFQASFHQECFSQVLICQSSTFIKYTCF